MLIRGLHNMHPFGTGFSYSASFSGDLPKLLHMSTVCFFSIAEQHSMVYMSHSLCDRSLIERHLVFFGFLLLRIKLL